MKLKIYQLNGIIGVALKWGITVDNPFSGKFYFETKENK
jgi:hypothetical protein